MRQQPSDSTEALPSPPSEAFPETSEIARPSPANFRRHLPHYEGHGNALFIRFSTWKKWKLPPVTRKLTLAHILHDHSKKMQLICAVVMPEHVHILYSPYSDINGNPFTKTEIVGSIKSASAHSINKVLHRKGKVWQDESFDHVIRDSENLEQKAYYIAENPVRRNLCLKPEDYPHLWRAWIEGADPEDT